MTQRVEPSPTGSPRVSAARRPQPTPPPVVWWAWLGAAFAAFIVYVFVAWIATGEATPTPPGPDPVPTWVSVFVVINQVFPPLFALTLIAVVVRQTLRRRRLSFDAKLLIAGFLLWWQDPLLSYVRPGVFYNANMINFGSWTERIPGWITPNGRLTAEPTIGIGFAYMWWFLGFSMFICAVMRVVHRRRPQISTPRLALICVLTATASDFLVEASWIRTGAYAYPSTIHALSAFGGTPYQMPIYHAFLHGGGTLGAIALLRYFRDDRGISWVERGIDRLNGSTLKADLISLLAVIAFLQLAFLLFTNIPIQWFHLHADTVPDFPSWMRGGVCGPGTAYPCPGPNIPVYLPGTPGPGAP
jgi:hypothetical protein